MVTDIGGTGIYCRLSHVRDREDTTKVDDQERICRQLAAGRGWHVTYVWKDNNRSAWQRNRKRPGWDEMLDAVKAGRVRYIVVYHGDRLIRQPWDLEQLLALADSQGIHLASPTGTRDLDSADDRFVLRIEAAQACRESDNISRRKKAGFERLRLERKAPIPGGIGGRAFGYRRNGTTPMRREAAAIREAAQRILAGDTLAAICRDLNAKGIKSTTGRPMTYGTLRDTLLRPRTAGLLADGITPGKWKPLITPDTQRRVRNELTSRRASKPLTGNTQRHLLSGIALCWACRKPLQVTNTGHGGKGVPGYGCVTPGCYRTRRNRVHLDAYVTGRVLRLLNSVDFTEEIERARGDDPLAAEVARLERHKALSQETINGLTEDDGEETVRRLLNRHREIARKLEAAKARAVVSRRRQTLAAHQGISLEQFKALPLRVRRDIISSAYTITIRKVAKRGPGFDPDGVQMKLRED